MADHRDCLVLFVHGLGGSPKRTWRGSGRLDFPGLVQRELGVEAQCYSYRAPLVRFPFFSKRVPVIQTLAEGLDAHIEYRCQSYKNIVLVCHSLGGLIARWQILRTIKRDKPLRVKALVLFATPNNGAALAEIAKFLSWNHFQLHQLCRESDLLETLNEDWIIHKVEDRLSTTFVVGGLDGIVTKASARLSPKNEILVDADRDHRDLVKPSTAQDLPFLFLRRVVESHTPGFHDQHDVRNARNAVKLLANSDEAYCRAKFSDSYDLIKAAYDLDRTNPDIWRQYIRVCFAQQKHERVAEFLNGLEGDNTPDHIACYRGELQMRQGQFQDAVESLLAVDDRGLYNAEYLTGVAFLFSYAESGDELELVYSKNRLRKAAALYPTHWWIRVNQMLVDVLIRELQTIEEDSPSGVDAHAETEDLLQTAIARQPGLLSARMYRLLFHMICDDDAAVAKAAAEDREYFAQNSVELPMNFPRSLMRRIELLHARQPATLARRHALVVDWLAQP